MQRFYLHLNYLHDFVADPDGSEYPDLQTARFEALQGTRDLAADCLRRGEEFKLWSVRVCNADGDMLDEVFVQEALEGIIPVIAVPSASTVSTL
ncbi:Hypothetical protein RG1141_CH23960 [Neorhizobium galegae bv. officinalis bv. officinalis str. HAMBI 1141]|uniref:DUF6894 domain-containing protein n=1 Tax=Neorhizobium galegae bv. officinalis bv. officinalis str. HAMBI 1141 TaxID=1028801 RepID=A0A068T9C1_NEOGA|nr:hypothetical protein [Neorhizobium galegae]CDN54734.1 Hypothetical protein RG1141_CH23960 [Neorhizobium galegae bv. officinalis bv. officinalis str. HAMBI 1141]